MSQASCHQYHHTQFLFLSVLPPLTTLSTISTFTSFTGAFFFTDAFPAGMTFLAVALAVLPCTPRDLLATMVVPALELADESMLCLPPSIPTSSDGITAAGVFAFTGAALLPGLDAGAAFGFDVTRSAVFARDAAVVVVIVADGLVGDIGRAPCGFSGDTYENFVGDGGCGKVRVLLDLGDRMFECADAAG
jgi:hypothetical protein